MLLPPPPPLTLCCSLFLSLTRHAVWPQTQKWNGKIIMCCARGNKKATWRRGAFFFGWSRIGTRIIHTSGGGGVITRRYFWICGRVHKLYKESALCGGVLSVLDAVREGRVCECHTRPETGPSNHYKTCPKWWSFYNCTFMVPLHRCFITPPLLYHLIRKNNNGLFRTTPWSKI